MKKNIKYKRDARNLSLSKGRQPDIDASEDEDSSLRYCSAYTGSECILAVYLPQRPMYASICNLYVRPRKTLLSNTTENQRDGR